MREEKKIELFSGTVAQYFKDLGIEEAAHILYFHKKNPPGEDLSRKILETDPTSKTTRTTEYPMSLDRGTEHSMSLGRGIEINDMRTWLNQLKQEGLFDGNIENASEFLLQLVWGILETIEKVNPNLINRVSIALTKLHNPEEKKRHTAWIYPNSTVLHINIDFLSLMSQYPPRAMMNNTFSQNNITKYFQMRHEKRALLWRLKEAKKTGNKALVQNYRNIIRIVRQRS